MIRLLQSWILLVRAIGDANRIRCIHSTIQHANFVDNGPLKVWKLLHYRDCRIELLLEVSIPALLGLAVVGVKVPTNVGWASARDVRASIASCFHKTLRPIHVHRHERGCQVFIALADNCCCGLLPAAHDRTDALLVRPACRKWLVNRNTVHRPKTNAS
jgi:hypothetical protein